jgi:protein TonB
MVAALHVGVVFLIARSLGIVPPLLDPPVNIETDFIDAPRVADDPPPRTDPQMQRVDQIRLPMPVEPPVDSGSQESITAQLVEPDGLVIDEPGSAVTEAPVVGPRLDARHPLTQPRYPQADIREENEGNADVEVYVLPNGRVGDARIAKSSGFERLDQSAIDEAKRNWRLVPATRDGVPFAQWYKVRVTFKLTNAR